MVDFPRATGDRFNAEQIAQYAFAAGFRGQALLIAVATALGESGGRVGVEGDVGIQTGKWGPSVGLWQIRSLNAQSGTGQWRDRQNLYDPMFNAKAAYAISNGGRDFGPWTVYRKGIYRRYLPEAREAVNRLGGDIGEVPDAGAADGGGGGAQQVGETGGDLTINVQGQEPQITSSVVRSVYETFMGRRPEPWEAERWIGKPQGEMDVFERQIGEEGESKAFTAAQVYEAFAGRAGSI